MSLPVPGRHAASTTAAQTRPIRPSKVPEITALFWVAKALTTALGESTSDYLVHAISPEVAVVLGFVAFCLALWLQFRTPRYNAWAYWLAVAMVGVFGTMVADVIHVGFGVPYTVSSVVFAVVLTGVFAAWFSSESTLSIHSITTRRREGFYWAAVVSTFALGTAVGDLSAITFHLGYLPAGLAFATAIVLVAAAYRLFRVNTVAAFWFAYVLTRPFGASFADWLGKPAGQGGVGAGAGPISIALAVAITAVVAFLAVTKVDTPPSAPPADHTEPAVGPWSAEVDRT